MRVATGRTIGAATSLVGVATVVTVITGAGWGCWGGLDRDVKTVALSSRVAATALSKIPADFLQAQAGAMNWNHRRGGPTAT